ncbi:Zinc finger protein [Plecturocebus cupreus]
MEGRRGARGARQKVRVSGRNTIASTLEQAASSGEHSSKKTDFSLRSTISTTHSVARLGSYQQQEGHEEMALASPCSVWEENRKALGVQLWVCFRDVCSPTEGIVQGCQRKEQSTEETCICSTWATLRENRIWLLIPECSGMISAHYNLSLLGSSDSSASASRAAGTTGKHHHAWLVFVFLVETRFHHIGQDGLKLLNLRWSVCLGLPKCWDYRHEPPCLAQATVPTPSHCVQLALTDN